MHDTSAHTWAEGSDIVYPLDNVIQPFQIDASRLRGRLVKLGPVLDDILTRHAYPHAVAHALGELLALAALLGDMMKFDGIFTLQMRGEGAIKLMVVDITSAGILRGYASFDEEKVAGLGEGPHTVGALFGDGHLALTVDQGAEMERYQGIVNLEGDSLVDVVNHYFRQSEQIDTGITVAVAQVDGRHPLPEGREGAGWRAAAMMLQRLPEEGGHALADASASSAEDGWRRAMVMLSTVTEQESLDPQLPPNDLLFRLFHEDGVRVFRPSTVVRGCRCSEERIASVLRGVPRAELEELKENGVVDVTCEFCSTHYIFDDAKLDALTAEPVA